MKLRALVTVAIGCFLSGCASTQSEIDSVRDGAHKKLAIGLLQRNPSVDAAVFRHAGGEGYIMSSGGGGLMFPIGLEDRTGSYSARFEGLKRYAPMEYSQIAPLLLDPDGTITLTDIMTGEKISRERRFYMNAFENYAKKFNRRMADQVCKSSELKR